MPHPHEIAERKADAIARFSANLKRFRHGTIYSQRTVSEALDCDLRWYQRLESGKHEPSVDTLARLAVIFSVDVSDFFKPTNEKRSETCL